MPPGATLSVVVLCCGFCSPSGGARPSSAAIFRTATSRYTTAEQSTLEDLKCQICLNTLRQCVALEPCGHNFCATCLSHHLGNSLQGGLQLSCPFRWALHCPAQSGLLALGLAKSWAEVFDCAEAACVWCWCCAAAGALPPSVSS